VTLDFWFIATLLAAAAVLGLAALWRRAHSAQERSAAALARAENELHALRQQAERTTAQLAALQIAQTEAVMTVNTQRLVEQVNDAAAALFGPRAAPGETLMVATRSVELDELVEHALSGGDDLDRQVSLNGQPYRARAIASAHNTGAVVTLTDLSELQRLGRARRDFIANISHELRTPLTSIRLLVESLLSGVAHEPQDANALLLKINTEVQALEQMAQELLDLAMIESGKSLVRLVPSPMEELVQRAVERLKPQAVHKQQTLAVRVSPGLTALADGDQLSRVLGNLIHNAIKFTPTGGLIQIQAELVNGDVLVKVSDTGPGIPPADAARVFERFFRGDRSRKSGGTGLGLAIAKHVVEAHGGRIWAESTGQPGRGATLCFTLLPAEHDR
jgi:two-component system phosphate regulon sensor histidine kinase PhoR